MGLWPCKESPCVWTVHTEVERATGQEAGVSFQTAWRRAKEKRPRTMTREDSVEKSESLQIWVMGIRTFILLYAFPLRNLNIFVRIKKKPNL